MTKDEMLKVLKDSFKDFKFYEDGHYYTYKDKPVGISVTRFIAEYETGKIGMPSELKIIYLGFRNSDTDKLLIECLKEKVVR